MNTNDKEKSIPKPTDKQVDVGFYSGRARRDNMTNPGTLDYEI